MDISLLKLELILSGLIGLIFVLDLLSGSKKIVRYAAVAGSLGVFIASLFIRQTGDAFAGAFISDGLSLIFKSLFLLNAFIVSMLSLGFLEKNGRYTGEYFTLIFSSTLGMLLLASSGELITFYIALELLSISSYVLSAFQKSEQKSSEAGMKYMLLGALASGMLLFGMSLVFGATGSLKFSGIAASLSSGSVPPIAYAGIVLIVVAMSFKIAAVPFHMWVPDVYEGAPSPVAAFISVGTKMAGFAVLMRLFLTAFGNLRSEWGILMAVLSAATIIIGNLLAIPQTNIKRFMGYSSIAQAGFVLIGLAMATVTGLASSVFYLAGYLFANLTAFGVIIIVGSRVEGDNIDDYSGLAKRSPFLSLALLISLMSLGGVPPLVGFFGKLYIFVGAFENGFAWLVALGVLMSVVSIYYYLMVLKRVYIVPSPDTSPIKLTFWEKASLSICLAGTLGFGLLPLPLFNEILSSVRIFLQ